MVKRFNAPPGWPPLPSWDWVPPPDWAPDPAWPEPPPGWTFYVDDPVVGGFHAWVKPILPVAAVLWIVGWLFLSSMGVFVYSSGCPSGAQASSQCSDRQFTAFLVMVVAQFSVLVLAVVCYLVWRRWLASVIVAAVGLPAVLIVFCVATDLIMKAGWESPEQFGVSGGLFERARSIMMVQGRSNVDSARWPSAPLIWTIST